MSTIWKLRFLMSREQKKRLVVLAGLLLIGMLFEMLGLGILIPVLGLMLNSNLAADYPSLRPLLHGLGNPTQLQLVILSMSVMIFVYIAKALFLAFQGWRQSKFSAELSAELSKDLFLGYLQQPYTFHLQRNSAQLLRNIQNEVGQFTLVSQSAINLSLEFTAVIGVAFMLVVMEPLGAIVVTSFLVLSAVAFHRLTKNKLLYWGQRRQLHAGYLNQHLLQGLGGVKDVKLMGREKFFLDEFEAQNNAYSKILARFNTLGFIPRLYLELLAVIGLAGLIVIMVMQHKTMNVFLPTLGVFVAAAFRMIPSVNRIMGAVQQMRYCKPVVDVLYAEFQLIHAVKEKKKIDADFKFEHELNLKDVCFSYPDTSLKALSGVSLTINKGECIGFIGPSGSGKSTLVDIILGLLVPESGKITIDGKNIYDSLRNWQNLIGYVPQSIYLTDNSLRNNVAFGISNDEIDEAAVNRAIKAAQLDEFVASLPEGLETTVGERGIRLSGGQRQRIGIARALYHDPEILVLDEATSALDNDTEKEVMLAINKLQNEKTLLIIAHRLSSLSNCDRIYNISAGKVLTANKPEFFL